jgi:hypothetical protein
MQTFEDAVRAARDAKASIEALTKAESLEREKLAALRVDFVREEQALVDSVAAYQKQAQEAREALQAALVRINDAPLQAQETKPASPDSEPSKGFEGEYDGLEPLSASSFGAVAGPSAQRLAYSGQGFGDGNT